MKINKLVLVTLIFLFKTSLASEVSDYDDYYEDCMCNEILGDALVNEIAGYYDFAQTTTALVKSWIEEKLIEGYLPFIDKYGPRIAGSDALEKAIDKIIHFEKLFKVKNISTEDVQVPHWIRGPEKITMLKPRQKNIAVLGLAPNVPTPPEGITAKVIVANDFNDFNKLDYKTVKGNIVLFNANFTNYEDTVQYQLKGAVTAAKKGAVACLIRSITPFSLYTPHTGFQQYNDSVTKIPSGAITLEDADLLGRLQDEGETIILNIQMSSTLENSISRNTIINIKGKSKPEKMVILSGHIDSWDVGQGILDNGAGMYLAALVPLTLNHFRFIPQRTVRSILWTGTEFGLIGSKEYVKRHNNELDNISLIMESDKGIFKPLGLDVEGPKSARCSIKKILKLFEPMDKMTESGHIGSDITVFTEKGVPGVSLLTENDRYYWYHHSEADTINVQVQDDFVHSASFFTVFSYIVANLTTDIPRN